MCTRAARRPEAVHAARLRGEEGRQLIDERLAAASWQHEQCRNATEDAAHGIELPRLERLEAKDAAQRRVEQLVDGGYRLL